MFLLVLWCIVLYSYDDEGVTNNDNNDNNGGDNIDDITTIIAIIRILSSSMQ